MLTCLLEWSASGSSVFQRTLHASSDVVCSCMSLVAPHCAILRDYLSDTPLLRSMGFWVSQHDQLGVIPPPPFMSLSPLESIRSGGAIPPPPQKGYLSDTCAIPHEDKVTRVRYPPLRYYLERVLRDMGGIPHWAAKCMRCHESKPELFTKKSRRMLA